MAEIAEVSGELADIKEEDGIEKFLIFTIQGKSYAFPSKVIGEIALFDAVYSLPLMPAYIPGVVNRYSVPYALLDISLFFRNITGRRNKLLVLKDDIDRIAILVDEVTDIADVRMDALETAQKNGGEADALSEAAAASFNYEENDILVLDIQKIINRITEETVLPEVDYD
jgi:purine-binding chemotaxis protein CheW